MLNRNNLHHLMSMFIYYQVLFIGTIFIIIFIMSSKKFFIEFSLVLTKKYIDINEALSKMVINTNLLF
jgi:hypothetical protein